jgi:hypothetical protein
MNERLSNALERFNRKERNLLVRAILGHKEKPLQLADSFRDKIAGTLDDLVRIPSDAWWATDYHISWLAGALTLLVNGESAVFHKKHDQPLPPWPNPPIPNTATQPDEGQSQLVEGNQEDVDLVVATGSELIMMEAKGFDTFDKEQLRSKLQRLELLHTFYKDTLRQIGNPVRFRFLLISSEQPTKIDICWPSWALKKDGNVPWIRMDLGDRLTVERCNSNHSRGAHGGYWHVIKQ